MQKLILLPCYIIGIIFYSYSQGNVGIGTQNPDNHAMLEISSDSKGLLIPRLNEMQRNMMGQNVPEGLMIFNTDDQQLQIFISSKWYPFTTGTPEEVPHLNEIYYIGFNENLLRRFVWTGTTWRKDTLGVIGAPPNLRAKSLEIGNAKNDNKNRVYVGTDKIYEFTYLNGSWTMEIVSTMVPYSMDIGDADNDGDNELYVGNSNKVYRLKWNGSSWDSQLIGDVGSVDISQPAVGDVENHDGLNELYVSGWDADWNNNGFVQYKWNGSAWVKTILGGAEQPRYGIAIGDGDNDNENEVYQANANWPLYQYNWNGSWSKTGINSYFLPTFPEIGDADRDGLNEIYVVRNPESGGGNNQMVFQHKWDGSSWIASAIPGPATYRKAVGDADLDGFDEIFSGLTTLYKIYWNGTTWTSTEIGNAATNFIQYIVVGDGDDE